MEHGNTAAPGASESATVPDTTVHTPPAPHSLTIQFTGSGSEYFRIWIVNLLLTIVTLGVYFAWAKVRRLRYFMGNTLVDGQPLGFHGDPKKMFKGYVLVGVLFILYSLAGEFSPTAGLIALLAVAALWPALFKSSMQFRLANTSWRGLRFRFHGDLRGAYRAMLPLFVPGVLIVGGLVLVPDREHPPLWYAAITGLAGTVTLAVSPWLLWNLKQYQHRHYALGQLQTDFRATAGAFYGLGFKILGLAILAVCVPVGIGMAFVFGLDGMPMRGAGMAAMAMLAIVPAIFGMFAVLSCLKPYGIARLQNLVWTKTGNSELRFISNLRARALIGLTLKNWFLIIITLGLYWPFAAVATARMRLQAVSVKTRLNPELLMAQAQPQEGDAAGDAAGDFFGLDVGL